MRYHEIDLFADIDLSTYLQQKASSATHVVDGIDEQTFITNTDAQIIEYVVSALTVSPIALHLDQQSMDTRESMMQVSDWGDHRWRRQQGGTSVASLVVDVSIPFHGDRDLWKWRPNEWTTSFPRGKIDGNRDGGVLIIGTELPAATDANEFKQYFERTINQINKYLDTQSRQIAEYNKSLAGKAQQAIDRRRARLGNKSRLIEVLDIPIRKRPGVPEPVKLPIKRARVVPLVSPGTQEQAYQISDEMYEHILNVIRHTGATYEAARETFFPMNEESLRDVLLANLNGHYEGNAKGEVFRGAGKTDISIEHKSRAAFIAECKLWKGDIQLREAIDQLLSYTTWRDGKTCLVVFNKQVAGFSNIRGKLSSIVESHGNYMSKQSAVQPGE